MLPRGLFDPGLEVILHQPGRALGQQRIQVHPVDEVQRVEDVALRLRHLLPVLVANQAVDVNLAKGHVAHELEAHHDHACDPEKDDVETGDQHVARVELAECLRIVWPSQGAERPQRRREPRVEHVLVLAECHVGTEIVPRADIVFRVADVDVAVIIVPGGDAMSPPQLPADAPVLDVVHPVEIGLRPVLRHEANAPRFNGFDGRLGKRFDFHVPLVGQVRFDDSV